jgi:hypothetical protein
MVVPFSGASACHQTVYHSTVGGYISSFTVYSVLLQVSIVTVHHSTVARCISKELSVIGGLRQTFFWCLCLESKEYLYNIYGCETEATSCWHDMICEQTNIHTHTHTHKHTYIHTLSLPLFYLMLVFQHALPFLQ